MELTKYRKMSFSVKLKNLSDSQINFINAKCRINLPGNVYKDKQEIDCYAITKKNIYLPLGVWKSFFKDFPNNFQYPSSDIQFEGNLYTKKTDPKKYRDQTIVAQECFNILLDNRTCFLHLSTGFGKTTLGIYFASKFKLKTLVLCHFDKVLTQWKEGFESTGAKVQRVKGNEFDEDADVYILGIQKASKMKRSAFKNIGFVILDEIHYATKTCLSKVIFKIRPKYLLGMTATPERDDNLHSTYPLYFGDEKNFIYRFEVKNFVVIKCKSPFQPKIRYKTFNGKRGMDWTHAINSLAYNSDRQMWISEIIENNYKKYKTLVLGSRIEECEKVTTLLEEKGCDVIYLNGKETRDAKILIAGMKKLGVGYDNPTLNRLILMDDTLQIEQYEGRIRTSGNVIYDIVDDHPTFENHWKERRKWYLKRGATITEGGEGGEGGDVEKPKGRLMF